MESGNK
jgi:hypothetical protein